MFHFWENKCLIQISLKQNKYLTESGLFLIFYCCSCPLFSDLLSLMMSKLDDMCQVQGNVGINLSIFLENNIKCHSVSHSTSMFIYIFIFESASFLFWGIQKINFSLWLLVFPISCSSQTWNHIFPPSRNFSFFASLEEKFNFQITFSVAWIDICNLGFDCFFPGSFPAL